VNQYEAAAIVGATFSAIGLLVYFVAKRTLWELSELLIVPLAIAAIGFWFTMQQDARLQTIEEQRAQDARLQAYIESMGKLVFNEGGTSQGTSEEKNRARAVTYEVLNGLDPKHKGRVVVYLYGAGMISTPPNPPPLRLGNADLSHSALDNTELRDIYLRYANLSHAHLSNVIWGAAILEDTDLRHANLTNAYLSEAYLNGSNLSGANLSGANLSGAKGIMNEDLEQQAESLEGATMPNGQKYEDWIKDR
jgi:hypothetical protein